MIGLIGISHQTASQDDRGRFALTETEAVSLVDDWQAMGYLRGAIVLCTCNRVEIYCELVRSSEAALHELLDSWLDNLELRDKMRSRVSVVYGEEVYRHLFRLSAGLESMVVGETQILGQVKDAFRLSVGQGQSSPLLSRLFHKAFEVAKRIRSRYLVSVVPISAASRAVDLVYNQEPMLAQKPVLIVGAGQMAEATLQHLRYRAVEGSLSIYNRTRERAERLAYEQGEIAIYTADALARAVDDAQVIFVTTSASSPILGVEHLNHRSTPVVVFDMAVPRNVCAEVGDLEGITLYTIDDLAGQSADVSQQLFREAEAIVSDGVREFAAWLEASEVRQVIALIQQSTELLLKGELALLPSDLSDECRQLIYRHTEHLRTTYATALAASLRELAEQNRLHHIDEVGKLFDYVLKKLDR